MVQKALLVGLSCAVAASGSCLGEFTACPTGECTMSNTTCGRCAAGHYLCPSDQTTCVASAAAYADCPGMAGTHLDASLSAEQRLDYLVAHVPLADQIAQLQNRAPELVTFGIPAYQWLNDDQHGVGRAPARATVFPNGCGLGATWSPATLHEVGRVVGEEARGLHNGFLAADSARSLDCNGCGLTLYAPNLNLVRDPRWGRAQEVYGEDPLHMGELVVPFVTGMQDNSRRGSAGTGNPDGAHDNRTGYPDGARYLRVGACCKHFAAYDVDGGAGTPDRSWFHAEVSARDLWESHMPAFRRCVVEARATHVMCRYLLVLSPSSL